MPEQFTLQIGFPESLSFDNFYVGSNDSATAAVKSLAETHSQSLFLWGSTGCGKSHLCQALYNQMESQGSLLGYVDCSSDGIHPSMLEGLEQYPIVLLDGLDAVIHDEQWAEAIFHCYNRTIQNKHNILMTANNAPKHYDQILPDLQSRLGGGQVYQLHSLTDDEKIIALKKRALGYGLELSTELALFLINRLPRGTHELFAVLKTLDKASLTHKRQLTIPFVKQILTL